MKKLLFSAFLAMGLLSLTGCYGTATGADAAVKTTKSKCGSGKCGDSKKTMKCGAGKCGTKAVESAKKCGASGKCGTAK